MSIIKSIKRIGERARQFTQNDENIKSVRVDFICTEHGEKFVDVNVFWKYRAPSENHLEKIKGYSVQEDLPMAIYMKPKKSVF